MRASYCYLAILPARKGALQAVDTLSPFARSRAMQLFDVPKILKDDKSIDNYLEERVQGIHRACGTTRSVYVDVHDWSLDLRISSGIQPITYIFDLLRARGMFAIPVTGTEADRNRDYLAAVKNIVNHDRRGACLRLAEDDLTEPQMLEPSVNNVLEQLQITPSELDVVLDCGYVGKQNPISLRAMALEALQAISRVGQFRNVVLAGGSVPEKLGKQDHGNIRRESRIEYDAWEQTITAFVQIPIAFGDYGIISPYYVLPSGPVNPPSRIRYTTLQDHVFYRAQRVEYRDICKQLINSSDFSGENFSAGDRRIYRCAKGLAKPGIPVDWIANDTNHHLEFAPDQIWRFLNNSGIINRFNLPEPERFPWLQLELA